MAFGDVLKQKLLDGVLLNTTDQARQPDGFAYKLREIAAEDIIACAPQEIDSDLAVRTYYTILEQHMDYLPTFMCDITPSNKQPRFRVCNRNIWGSNAFRKDGLANHPALRVRRTMSLNRKGEKYTFAGKEEPT